MKYLEDKVIFQKNVLKENGTELKDLKILQSKNESDYKNSITLQETVKKRFFLINDTKKKLEKHLKIIKLNLEQTKIADSNLERSKYQGILESDNQELQDNTIKFSEKKNERDLLLERINMIHEERNILTKEKTEKEILMSHLKNKIEKEEEEDIKYLRDKEQNIIFSSGNTYTILQSYEEKIKKLLD